jgi:RNA polymerase sigma-70 factor (ECF subfamily)
MPEPTHAISREWIHAFYRAHHRALAAYAASLTRSRDDAEDLVHEALAGMLEVRGAIENPEAYAYRAIRNRAIDRARRAVRVEAARSIDIGCAPPAQARDWTELCRALEALSPAAAEVVVLHARSGLSFPQIAAVLEEPVGTVSARYSRALTELRAALAKEEQHG